MGPDLETLNRETLWRPHPGPQTVFLAAGEFEALYGGAAGGGKSDALLYGGLRQIRVPKYRALLLRQSFPELRDLMDRAGALFPQLGAVWSEQQKRWRFPSGATYEFIEGICFPPSGVSPLALEASSQWDESTPSVPAAFGALSCAGATVERLLRHWESFVR